MQSFESIFETKLLWFTTVVFGVYLFIKYVVYNYWHFQKIPYDVPTIPLGNVPISYFQGKIHHGDIIKFSYDRYKKHLFHGLYIFHQPVLCINHPELIQQVLIKNFNNFYNRGTLNDEHLDPLSTGLVRLSGDKWKRLRAKLTPTFSSGKLKQMYVLIEEISDNMIKVFDEKVEQLECFEVQDIVMRFTVDVISSIAFGSNCDSLNYPNTDFCTYGKASNHFGRGFLLMTFYAPYLAKFFSVPEKRKQTERFFVNLFKDMVDHRKKEKIVRNDFLNMLIQLMEYGKLQDEEDTCSKQSPAIKLTEADKLTITEAVGQAFFFFAAGQETTSTLISCCLFELARNHDIQDKLYKEIYEVSQSPGGLSYEKINNMQYLDMVCNETLRKYPGAPIVTRICVDDFQVPGSDFCIKKGTKIVIPIKGVHWDPDIYPDPEVFDPERFTPENVAKRHSCSFLPFGEGPRQCIGRRLGYLKPKIALFNLLLRYKFSTCDKTPTELKYLTDYFIIVPEDIYLKVEKRRKE